MSAAEHHQETKSSLQELKVQFVRMKREHQMEKGRLLESIQKKQLRLTRIQEERDRYEEFKQQLLARVALVQSHLNELRIRNNRMRSEERAEELNLLLQYQNGLNIDLDTMTYEQLLQLQEKMGTVSRGLPPEQLDALRPYKYMPAQQQQNCIVCCVDLQANEEVLQLSCRHTFHSECLRDWLTKQKICPICRHEVVPPGFEDRS